MRHLKLIPSIAAAAAFALGTTAASAADLAARYTKAPPMVMAYSWSGCYVGVNGGYGWGENHSTLAPSPDAVSQAFWNPAFIAGAAPSNFGYTNSGGVAGGQVGCNWQSGQFVFGGEADIDWANLKGSQSIATAGIAPFVPGFFASSSNLQWLGTVRGRIGWSPATADHWLFYATGGLAYGSVNYNTSFTFPATNDFQTLASTNTQAGWTAGAGVEWAFNNNWTVRAEYLYVDLGNRTFTTVGTGRAANVATTLTDSFSNRYNIVRVGLNYKFNWGGPVVAKY
jgi:outer membrane immunogenic protein